MRNLVSLLIFITLGISNNYAYAQQNISKNEKNTLSDNYYMNLGILAAENNKPDSAIHYISKSIELNKKNPIAYYIRATVFYELKHFDKALEDLNQSIKINPKDQKAIYLRAIVNQNKMDYLKASKDYETLIKMNSTDSNYYFQYAYCLQELNENQKSIDAYLNYEKLVKVPAKEFFVNIIYNYVQLKKYSEALTYIIKSKKQGYISHELIQLEIDILSSQQKCDEALKLFEDNEKSLENKAITLTNLGMCLLRNKDYTKANQALLKAYEIDRSLVENLFNIAYVQQQLGNPTNTIVYLEQFVDESKNRNDLKELRDQAIRLLDSIKKNK